MDELALSKYEGLGNDFLIGVETPGPFGAELARALCDRHTGIGADGLIHLSSAADDAAVFTMELRNADGGQAETSGNGLRCAALAAFHHGLIDETTGTIITKAGAARVEIVPDGGHATVRVEMGVVSVEPVISPVRGWSAFRVDTGNPHLVLIGEGIDDVDLSRQGPSLEASVPGGQNVEFVERCGPDELRLVVWERGVGVTLACGTGSVAAAAAARRSRLVGDCVVVHNPAGSLFAELFDSPDRCEAALTGPARRVAQVAVDLADFFLDQPVHAVR